MKVRFRAEGITSGREMTGHFKMMFAGLSVLSCALCSSNYTVLISWFLFKYLCILG